VKKPTMRKIDADEKELLKSVESGEAKSAGGGKRERTVLPLPTLVLRGWPFDWMSASTGTCAAS
jgi:hypothetical protein